MVEMYSDVLVKCSLCLPRTYMPPSTELASRMMLGGVCTASCRAQLYVQYIAQGAPGYIFGPRLAVQQYAKVAAVLRQRPRPPDAWLH